MILVYLSLGKNNAIIPALVFLATAALFIRTTAPTLGGAFDSEEFQHVAYTLGIAHATGYPLYLILGKIFITLVPSGNVAYRMNLLSARIGAGAATLIYAITFHLTRQQIAPSPQRRYLPRTRQCDDNRASLRSDR